MIIRIRDDFECQLCGSHKNLQCHHITPKGYARYVLGWDWAIINDIHNGILLCRRCHKSIHKKNKNYEKPWNNKWDEDFYRLVKENAEQTNLQDVIC